MIDIHTHVLPIDDGPENWLQSIEMCRAAEKTGIKTIVCTPHVLTPGYGNDKQKINENIKILRQKLKEAKVNVELIQGAENLYDHSIPISGTGYVLIEFPLARMPMDAEARVKELLEKYKVIIAHPERYPKVRDDTKFLPKLVDLGCYVQINAHSLLSWRHRGMVKNFLKQGLVHFIATDMHSKKDAGLLKKAVEKAKKYIPNAEKFVTTNPEKMLRGEEL